MAYTKTPTVDTYSSAKVALFREINLRDGGGANKDEDYLNVFMEVVKQSKVEDNRHFIFKRAGTSLIVPSVGGAVRGMYFWADQNKLLYSVSKNIYVYNVNTGVITTITNVFTTSTGTVGFTEFLYNDGTVKIIATDGSATTGIVTIDTSNTVATCADADLPAHLPHPIFLDGYLFVVKQNTSDIYNSDNNDPLTWTTDAYISAEMEGDVLIQIIKVNNYIVAFGSRSIEYFWDAGIAAPDSPLQRNDTPVKYNRFLAGLCTFGNTLYYIGLDNRGQPSIFMLKDFKIEDIGSDSITRYLNSSNDSIAEWIGTVVSFQGHAFYVINAGDSKSWAIDLDTQLITRFAYQDTQIFDIANANSITTTQNTRTYFTLDDGTSNIYKFDGNLYQDNNVNFTCRIITEASAFGTMNRKTMSRATLIADRPPNNSDILVQWSDDDYQTYNTGVYTNLNQDLPSIYRLGSFRQRIFKLTYQDNYPMRIQELEVNINKGNS